MPWTCCTVWSLWPVGTQTWQQQAIAGSWRVDVRAASVLDPWICGLGMRNKGEFHISIECVFAERHPKHMANSGCICKFTQFCQTFVLVCPPNLLFFFFSVEHDLNIFQRFRNGVDSNDSSVMLSMAQPVPRLVSLPFGPTEAHLLLRGFTSHVGPHGHCTSWFLWGLWMEGILDDRRAVAKKLQVVSWSR